MWGFKGFKARFMLELKVVAMGRRKNVLGE